MKKIISVLLAIIITFALSSCKSYTLDYNEEIIKFANNYNFEEDENSTFDVELINQQYNVKVNGETIANIPIEDDEIKGEEQEQEKVTKPIDGKFQDIISKAKVKIHSYIDATDFFENKDELHEYINSIPIMIEVTDNDSEEGIYAAAYFNGKTETIYIPEYAEASICEWGFVHEYIHALAQKTNGGIENMKYRDTYFDEAMTDIIVYILGPEEKEGFKSGYTAFYYYIKPFISTFGMDSIKGYYYGYESVFETISEEELDMYVFSISNILSYEAKEDDTYQKIWSGCVNHWRQITR